MNYLLCKFIELAKSFNIPDYIGLIIFSIFPFIMIISFLVLTVLVLVLAERKLLGYFTQRKGPNRVGVWGILQTVADALKLICKENIEPSNSKRFLFTLSPLIAFTSIILLWCVIPFNSEFHMINSEVSLLIYFIIAAFPMLFHFLAGYSSCNRYSIIGAYRTLSVTVSYTVPIMFALMSVICITNSMDLNKIIEYRINGWVFFPNIIGFIILYIASIAKLNRCPFDLSEAESELVCGYHTEYSGMRFAMFFLGEYAELFIMSALIVILFLGGYLPPFGNYLSNTLLGNCSFSKYFLYFEQTIWLILKTIAVIFSIIWIRATLPRMTQTATLKFFWSYLTPISILNLIVVIWLKMGI